MMNKKLKNELIKELNETKPFNASNSIDIIRKWENIYKERTDILNDIEREASYLFGIKNTSLFVKNRKDNVVWCRMMCMRYAIKTLDFEVEEVAIHYGKDRTLVLHALKRYDELKDDILFGLYIEQFSKLIEKVKKRELYLK